MSRLARRRDFSSLSEMHSSPTERMLSRSRCNASVQSFSASGSFLAAGEASFFVAGWKGVNALQVARIEYGAVRLEKSQH